MAPVGVQGRSSEDRRRQHRVRLSVPVLFNKSEAWGEERFSSHNGRSKDLSTGGVYLTTSEGEAVSPGELLRVSIAVPRDARRAFPFSRIVGSCRVLRVEVVSSAQGVEKGLALAFCGGDLQLFGAI